MPARRLRPKSVNQNITTQHLYHHQTLLTPLNVGQGKSKEDEAAKEDGIKEDEVKGEDDSDSSGSEAGVLRTGANKGGAAGKAKGNSRVGSASANVRAVNNSIEKMLCEVKRNLLVEPLTLVFAPSTIWGSRKGRHDALLVVAGPHEDADSGCLSLASGFMARPRQHNPPRSTPHG